MTEKIIELLIIEDDVVDQLAFKRLVETENLPYAYTIAGSVFEAKQVLESHLFDAIIVDYHLGDGSAFDIFSSIASIEAPIIFITGTGDESTAVKAMKMGAYDYIIKDPEHSYLKLIDPTIRNAIRHKQAEAELQKVYEELELQVAQRTGELSEANSLLAQQIAEREQAEEALQQAHDELVTANKQLRQEVEERSRAESALEEERNLMRSLIENLPDHVYVKDTQSRFLLVNDAVRRHLGADTIHEIIGNTDHDFSPSELADQYYANEQTLLQSGEPLVGHEEPIFDHETGSIKWISTTKVPFRDSQNRIAGLVGLNRDITELLHTKEALQNSEKHVTSLLEAVTDYIYSVELTPELTVAATTHSLGCVAVTGYTAQDYEADPDLWHRMIHEDDRDMVIEQVDRVIAGDDIAPFEHRITHKDGSIRWLKNTWVPRFDEQRQLVAYDGLIRDVTERKLAEEALAAERNLLRTLIDNLPDYIFVKDIESRFVINNTAHLDILGAQMPEEVQGKSDFDIFPEELAAQYYADEQALFATGRALVNRQETTLDKQGNKQWLLTTKVPLYDNQNHLTGLVGVSRDITDIRRMQEALRESETLIRAVLNSMTAHIAVLNKQGTIVEVNQAWERFARDNQRTETDQTGVGVNYLDICRQAVKSGVDEAAVALTGISAVLDGSQSWVSLEYPCHSPTQKRWFFMVATPLLTKSGGAVVSHLEITERKLIEEALRYNEEYYRTILENAFEGLSITDREGIITYQSPASEQILGLKPEKLIGQKAIDLVHPDDVSTALNDFSYIMDNPGVPLSTETRFRHFDGSWRDIEAKTINLFDNPIVKGMVSNYRDVTARKRAEEEKAFLFEEVSLQRERLRALTGRLAETQEAERKQLARELHDQVGQNLTALGLNLNIISTQLAQMVPVDHAMLHHLDDSLTLVEQTTVRIRNVMADLRPPVLDDYGLVAALRWYGKRFATRADLAIVVQGDEPEPRLPAAVEHALFRIVQEALTNVAKHARASQVDLEIIVAEELVQLRVSDDGQGFDLISSDHSLKESGWGLLTMTERAEAVGGHCRIESCPDLGTKVIVEVSR